MSNANHIAGIKNIYKDVKLDDGLLEVVFCTIKNRKDILKSLYFLTINGPSKVPGIYFYRTNNIRIKINNEDYKPWCVDGEKMESSKSSKYEVGVKSRVRILTPKRNISNLFIKNT